MTKSSTSSLKTHKKTSRDNPFSYFEFWPNWFFYLPVVAYCLYLSYRYKSLSLPTLANPLIDTGGLCGESKSAIFQQASANTQKWIAPYGTFITGADDRQASLKSIKENNLSFPLIIKPDIGCHGNGIKLARSQDDVVKFSRLFRRDIRLILQNYIDWEFEAGIFYIRYPDEKKGRISSLAYKHVPYVIGDGKKTIKELILSDPRLSKLQSYFPQQHHKNHHLILPKGKRYLLSVTGNHCKGAHFVNGCHNITPQLESRIDEIMQGIPEFYFGRIDLKFPSFEALKTGQALSIIEINGIGGEAIHIWDHKTTLKEAYRSVFSQWKACYRVGYLNALRGYKPCGLLKCLIDWNRQRKLMNSYPPND